MWSLYLGGVFRVSVFLWCIQGHTDELWGLASHPSREMFLTCAQDRLVCLWNSLDHSLHWSRTLEVRGRGLLTDS